MFNNIPDELKALPNWVCWRVELRDNKPTKVPYTPGTNDRADVTNPQTWTAFDTAVAMSKHYSGIGFVFTREAGFTGIDLDVKNSINAPNDSDKWSSQADIDRLTKIYEAFPSYAEKSPSGQGAHIIVRGTVPEGRRRLGVEIYSDGRFFTMTGDVLRRAPIAPGGQLLEILWAELEGSHNRSSESISGEQHSSDETIYNRAASSKNAELFLALWNGQWQTRYPSQSEADQALMNILAFYTQNHEQLARLFHYSALGRRKKAYREDYLKDTIDRSLDQQTPMLDMSAFAANFAAKVQAQQERAAVVEMQRRARIDATLNARIEQATKPPEVADTADLQAFATEYSDRADIPPPPGVVGELAQFFYAQSPYPLARVSLVGALAFMSGMCGRAYNVLGTGCNLYLLLVAPTSAGKEAMSGGIAKLAQAIAQTVPSVKHYYGIKGLASGQALYRVIKERRAFLLEQGEFGVELQRLVDPRAVSTTRDLKKAYLELFTKSGAGQQLGADTFADKIKDTEALPSPALSILAETAPPHLYDHLNETMLADGFLPRFILIEQTTIGDTYNPKAFTVQPPPRLIETLAHLAQKCLLADNQNNPHNVTFTPEADALQDAYRAATRKYLVRAQSEATKQLWNRAHVKACRVAALIAVGCMFDQPNHVPTITKPILEWAIALVNAGAKQLEYKFVSGGVGCDDSRAAAETRRVIGRYLIGGYGSADTALQKAKIVPYRWLQQNVRGFAAFRAGIGGPTQTFYRVIKQLTDDGTLMELPISTVFEQFATYGKHFAILDASVINEAD